MGSKGGTQSLEVSGPFVVPKRLLNSVPAEQLNQVVRRGRNKQLLMEVRATPSKKRLLSLRVLIDTGAETNLIRRGLLPSERLRDARKPLALVTASGCRMGGGLKEVPLKLEFAKTRADSQAVQEWSTMASFYDAEIQVDAILGYKWLAARRLEVFPPLKSLAFVTSSQTLLKG